MIDDVRTSSSPVGNNEKRNADKKLKTEHLHVIIEHLIEEKMIVDLLARGNSPNTISRHFMNVYRLERKMHAIRRVLLKNAGKITRLNRKFDRIAGNNIMILEIDETFKGRKGVLLVVIDSVTGYLYFFQWIPKRDKETILNVLLPYRSMFSRVNLILTDGAPYFPEVVHELCPRASHQICLIHVMRNLYKKLMPYQKALKEKQAMINELKRKINEFSEAIKERRYKLKCLRQKHGYHVKKRNQIRQKLGINPYQRGILQNYPELRKLNELINKLSRMVRSMTTTLQNNKKKLKSLQSRLLHVSTAKNQAWNDYMLQCRTLHRFYNLFTHAGKQYERLKRTFITRLIVAGASSFMKEVLRVLTRTEGLDTVNKEGCPVQLDRDFMNTNAIESINSQLRPILDALKKITNTLYITTIFELVKLRLNTSPPHSGPRKNLAPIERYGYNLKGRTFIDLIFHGLPVGPQYGLHSARIDLSKANPHMIGKLKIDAES